ncbi:MAG: hypothetical protein HFJ50_09375 [Clostridia bacterium]|nr:hypothetical protein [Clostridia bacterium]
MNKKQLGMTTDTPGDDFETLENHDESEFGEMGYFLVSGGNVTLPPAYAGGVYTIVQNYMSTDTILYSTTERQDLKDFSFDIGISTEKRINFEKFLGLWRNSEGKYVEGAEWDENGIDVPWPLPDEEDAKIYPPEQMASENGQDLSELIRTIRTSRKYTNA